MTIIVPNVGEVAIAEEFLNQSLYLKLYSNNLVPNELSTAASFNEVTGGGYVAKLLSFEDWTISDQGIAIGTIRDFSFTAPTTGPGSIYGYYIVDAEGILRWAERFPTSVLPFVPVAGSLIRITPRIQVS